MQSRPARENLDRYAAVLGAWWWFGNFLEYLEDPREFFCSVLVLVINVDRIGVETGLLVGVGGGRYGIATES